MICLQEFWNEYKREAFPNIHPQDKDVFLKNSKQCYHQIESYKDYCTKERFLADSSTFLHLSLDPDPFAGNLETAEIFILLLNPGFGPSSYYWQEFSNHGELPDCLSIRDVNHFPNKNFDPTRSAVGDFLWWQRKFDPLIRHILAEYKTKKYWDVLSVLSHKIASIELFPYASQSFRWKAWYDDLKSVNVARDYVKQNLIKRAAKGDITLICLRGAARWGLRKDSEVLPLCQNSDSICIYEPKDARAAGLGPRASGGKAIIKQLKKSVL
ncbi:MAG: hypothetical protein N4A65_08465 [Cohaesibacter sp.]|jgi:hypothetical protein|nr:hypothetical protein [Cohaesibacter sp.]